MSWLGPVAAVALGAVFVVAGASKLAAGPRWPADARALGAPAIAIPLVPWAELAIGAALVAQLAVPVAAAAAIALLLAFSALLSRHLGTDSPPVCACFGAWSARPVGPGHLVRNGVLLVLAIVAVVV